MIFRVDVSAAPAGHVSNKFVVAVWALPNANYANAPYPNIALRVGDTVSSERRLGSCRAGLDLDLAGP